MKKEKEKLRKILHKIKNDIILLCAIILLVESGGIFLMTIGVLFLQDISRWKQCILPLLLYHSDKVSVFYAISSI